MEKKCLVLLDKRKFKNPCTFLYHFVRTKFVFTFEFHIVIRRTLKGFPTFFFRAAFKFGRRVHFALRRKMLNPPIARLPAI